MAINYTNLSFGDKYPRAFATSHEAEAYRGAVLAESHVSYPAGESIAYFPPAFCAANIPGRSPSEVRILPRQYAIAAATTSDTVLSFSWPGVFIPGDVLTILGAYGTLTVDSSSTGWAVADTATITFNSVAHVYTVVAADIGTSLAATNLNVAIKIAGLLADRQTARIIPNVFQVGTAAIIGLIGLDNTAYTTVTADTGSNGTFVASGAAMVINNTAIGTVSAVGPASNGAAGGTVTLTAVATAAVPVGAPVGVAGIMPAQYGVFNGDLALTVTKGYSKSEALFTECALYRSRVPYWDADTRAILGNQITLV
jgi:hypothetical protein